MRSKICVLEVRGDGSLLPVKAEVKTTIEAIKWLRGKDSKEDQVYTTGLISESRYKKTKVMKTALNDLTPKTEEKPKA